MRFVCAVRRRAGIRLCSTAAARADVSVTLHPWSASQDQTDEALRSVGEGAAAAVNEGRSFVVRGVGAKSVIAVVKALASVTGGVRCSLDFDPSHHHTFTFTVSGGAAAASERPLAPTVDVLDKRELPTDLNRWAAESPTDYYNERNLKLDFDKNTPKYEKPYALSGSELVEEMVRCSVVAVRGMGPSLFNCIKSIAYAQNVLSRSVCFDIEKQEHDEGVVAVFKDDIKNYFERGAVHFRDEKRLPSVRGDNVVWLDPEGYVDDDTFCVKFYVMLAGAA